VPFFFQNLHEILSLLSSGENMFTSPQSKRILSANVPRSFRRAFFAGLFSLILPLSSAYRTVSADLSQTREDEFKPPFPAFVPHATEQACPTLFLFSFPQRFCVLTSRLPAFPIPFLSPGFFLNATCGSVDTASKVLFIATAWYPSSLCFCRSIQIA